MEWALIFAGGILGSSHCLGMCGPFALMIGAASQSPAHNVRRQVTYGLGRVFTYSTLGALAGFGGWRLVGVVPLLAHLPAVLSAIAGLLLMYFGLATAGVLPQRVVRGQALSCVALGGFRQLFRAPSWPQVFLAGMYTGLLPCGLTYAFLTMAAGSMQMGRGAVTMAVFGLGTLPMMVLAGFGPSLLGVPARQRMLRAAGWCVVATGVLCLWRAAVTFDTFGGQPCPYCSKQM